MPDVWPAEVARLLPEVRLAQAARGGGQFGEAECLPNAARQAAPGAHLQAPIDLWLTELYPEQGRHAATAPALSCTEARLERREHRRLSERAERLRLKEALAAEQRYKQRGNALAPP